MNDKWKQEKGSLSIVGDIDYATLSGPKLLFPLVKWHPGLKDISVFIQVY